MEKLVIVGSGPAGLTAALYAARAGLAPLVVEGIQPGGQITTTMDVENYPGFPEAVNGTDLVQKMRAQAERFGARCLMNEVASSDFSGKPFKLKLADDSVLESRCVIIATGATALYLGLESERKLMGHGVSACATCDGVFYKNKPVAVVGGGDTAMEESLFLSRMCSQVTLIHRRNEFRASRVMADRVKQHPRIKIIWDTVVEEVLDVQKGEVTGLRLRNVKTGETSTIKVDGFFCAIGHKPNTGPFKGQVNMDPNGFIVTDNTKTSVKGVFAAGDVQDHVYRQAITAAGTGCMAALEALRYLESEGK